MVQILGYEESSDGAFLILELVDGYTLAEIMKVQFQSYGNSLVNQFRDKKALVQLVKCENESQYLMAVQ